MLRVKWLVIMIYRLLISLIFLPLLAKAQPPKARIKTLHPKPDFNCFYSSKYNARQRLSFYPFNIADTIKLVSFYNRPQNLAVRKNTLLKDSLIEIKVLTTADITALTDILYNNFYKRKVFTGIGSVTSCFEPRNAILFFDTTGKLEGYMLLCFHCGNFEMSSKKVNFGEECTQKMDLLRQFFIKQAIIFGTDIDKDYGDGRRDVVAPPITN